MRKKKKCEIKVIRNFDYTITLQDSKSKEIKFRDICGKDLEFIEHTLYGEKEESEENKEYVSFEGIVKILNYLSVENIDFMVMPRRIVVEIFLHVKNHILLNYLSKYKWLQQCYAIQNGTFSGVAEMEKVPMTKFVAMIQAHQEAVESINKQS